MIDITHKSTTLREATAEAVLQVSSEATMEALRENRVPKGHVLEVARTAGLFAVKRTADLIPDCHPLPIEYTGITYAFDGLEVRIAMTVRTIYKTGVEVEAMHGVSVVALTMYDMLKPIDKGVEIGRIRLVQKRGGKSSFRQQFAAPIVAGVVVCSDSIAGGQKEDRAGKVIVERLGACEVSVKAYTVIPDEAAAIQAQARALQAQGCRLIIFTGGTGLSPRDVTPEALLPLLDRRIPGIEEAVRRYGQDRMPYAMLSRSVAGTMGEALVLALPGSTNGAKESMDALFPHLLHLFHIFQGGGH